jgi:mannitol-1-phosphate 5-dehydrogenase
LSQSGYEVIFADVNEQMIDALNVQGKYTVHVTDLSPESFEVEPVKALNTRDPRLIEAIAASAVITTAVGLNILPHIAPVIAKGVEVRAAHAMPEVLHIIACENGIRASSKLQEEVLKLLKSEVLSYFEEWVAFVDCSVDRIVPPVKTENPTAVSVERFHEWNVDETQLKGRLQIEGMNIVGNLSAYIERKLFTLNTGHAVLAYMGYLKGYNRIDDCIADPEILNVVRGAMSESGAALLQRFGLDASAHAAYIEKIIQRFRNPYLEDTVDRIGRDPLRKLSASDRLIAPLTAAYGYGLSVDNLLLGIGAALHYQHATDAQSMRLQETIAELGIVDAVAEITGIAAGSPLNEQIKKAYDAISSLSNR